MEYIKDPKMIEVRSFEIIQGIIDDIRPGYKFKNEIEEKIIKDVCVTIVHANVFLSCIIGSPKALPLFGRFALTAVQTGLRKRSLQSG